MGLVNFNPDLISLQMSELMKQRFDSIFQKDFFTKNSKLKTEEITKRDLQTGIDFLIIGFKEFSEDFPDNKFKLAHKFLCSTKLPGAIIFPSNLNFFETQKIHLTSRCFLSFSDNSNLESLMLLSIYFFVQIFLEKIVLVEYVTNKCILLISLCFIFVIEKYWNKTLINLNNSENISTILLFYSFRPLKFFQTVFQNDDIFLNEIENHEKPNFLWNRNFDPLLNTLFTEFSNESFNQIEIFFQNFQNIHFFLQESFLEFRCSNLIFKLQSLEKIQSYIQDEKFFQSAKASIQQKIDKIEFK